MKQIFTFLACVGLSCVFAQTTTFNTNGTGRTGSVQQYVVTGCITEITVDAYGAQGGNSNGGLGARTQGSFTVAAGDTIYVVVGQQGTVNACGGINASAGGGGGSFVWKSNGPSRTLLLAAGGGGGGNTNWSASCSNGIAAVTAQGGTQGAGALSAVGGTGGNGGSGTAPSGTGSGGAGWLSDGGNSTYGTGCTGGLTWPLFTGGYGSNSFGSPGQGDGGYGGGGGAVCGNGGGGGYSGGGGGEGSSCRAGGGGGGSYNSGTNQTNTAAVQTGDGIVHITPNAPAGAPAQPGAITGNVTVCAGDTVVFSISSVPNANSYAWNVPVGATFNSGQGTTTVSVTFGSTSGTVSVVANNACGSSPASSSAITVNQLPNISLGADFSTCGNGDTLDAGIQGATYLWNTGASTQTISINNSGSYSVFATDVNGCSDSDTINVTINALPSVTASAALTTVCQSDNDVTLSGSPAGGIWSGPGVTGNMFDPSADTGWIALIYNYTDTNGCSGSDTAYVNVDICTGIDQNSISQLVNLYPNPSDGNLNLNLPGYFGNVSIDINDASGRTIHTEKIYVTSDNTTHQINLSSAAQGTYLIRVSDDLHSSRTRIQIIH